MLHKVWLSKAALKSALLVAGMALLNACTFNVRLVQDEGGIPEASMKALAQSANHYATVYIGTEFFVCKVLKCDEDHLVVADREVVTELPIKAISRIVIEDAKTTGMSAVIAGGLSGGLLGYLIGMEAASDHQSAQEIKIGVASAGAMTGALAVKLIGEGSRKEYPVNNKVKNIELVKGWGRSIKAQAIQERGVFSDLLLNAGETFLELRVYEFDKGATDGGGYIALYDVYNGKDITLRWKVYDESFIKEQKERLASPMKNQIFKNSELNKE